MIGKSRLRSLASFGILAVMLLVLVACQREHPNTTFEPHSDYGRDIDFLWDRLLLLGTIVFVVVESALIYVVVRFRKREGQPVPPQTHGNVPLEILWTLIPALVLVFIAIPTVRTIFKTQSRPGADALQIEVIGHQWWWEFRYPQYGFTTANEIYLPTGRTVNFALTSKDVIHSFWAPQLGGKRDAVTNRTNYITLTPDSTLAASVWNGFCTEYCGDQHAMMRFRVFTVSPAQFESWAAAQKMPAAFGATAPAASPSVASAPAGAPPQASSPSVSGGSSPGFVAAQAAGVTPGTTRTSGTGAEGGSAPAVPRPIGSDLPGSDSTPARAPRSQLASNTLPPGYTFPHHRIPSWARPNTPIPRGLTFTRGLRGNPARGQQAFLVGGCAGCHTIKGNPAAVGPIGPDLTHIGSRSTLAAGSFPNTPAYLALWIKNARAMKPGVLMPSIGKNEYDPDLKKRVTIGGLDDQQIADVVAYLMMLK